MFVNFYTYHADNPNIHITLFLQHLLKNIDVVLLNEPDEILPAFQLAYQREDSKSTLIIEWGDYYNEK